MSTPDDETTHDGDVVDVDEQPVMRPHREASDAEPGDFAPVPEKKAPGPITQRMAAIKREVREEVRGEIEASARRKAWRRLWVTLGTVVSIVTGGAVTVSELELFSFKDGLPVVNKTQYAADRAEDRVWREKFEAKVDAKFEKVGEKLDSIQREVRRGRR